MESPLDPDYLDEDLIERLMERNAELRMPGVVDGVERFFEKGRPAAAFQRAAPRHYVLRSASPDAADLGRRTAASAEEFAARWAEAVPALAGFDLAEHGLVAAGGAVASVLMGTHTNTPRGFSDVDLFLVGHPDDASRRAAVAALHRHLVAGAGGQALVAHRTAGAVTWCGWSGAPPIQVVLRAYSTIPEVLHGFDLGPAQVAYDGLHLRTTAFGRLAADRGLVPVDFAVRRCSFERRLAKYFRRGYDLCFPGLPKGVLHRAARLARLGPLNLLGARSAAPEGADKDEWGAVASDVVAHGPVEPNFDAIEADFGALWGRVRFDSGAAPFGGESGPGSAVFVADYSELVSGGIPYGQPDLVRLWNLQVVALAEIPAKALLKGSFQPGALMCAVGSAAAVADPGDLPLGLPPSAILFNVELEAALKYRRPSPARVARLVGDLPGVLGALLLAADGGPDAPEGALLGPMAEAYAARAEALRRAAEDGGLLPYDFAPVADRTALSGDPRFATTLLAWLRPQHATTFVDTDAGSDEDEDEE